MTTPAASLPIADPASSAVPVSVVICTYGNERWNTLALAVRSVTTQRPRPREVIIVVDHNPDLLHRATVAFPDVRVIPNIGTKGLSDARNTGLEAASSEIVAFLDDDAEAASGWLAALVDAYEDSTVVGVGGWVDPWWPDGGPPPWWPEELLWVIGCSYRGLPRARARVRNMIGANMSMRRAVARAAGGFSPAVGRVGTQAYGVEETELCIRVTQGAPQARFLHEPSARVRHRVARDRLRMGYLLAICYNEGVGKAAISTTAGHGDALSAERSFIRQALPRGVLVAVREGARGNFSGLSRLSVLLAGILAAGTGYAVTTARRWTPGKAWPRWRNAS
jgi:hypothetical protein